MVLAPGPLRGLMFRVVASPASAHWSPLLVKRACAFPDHCHELLARAAPALLPPPTQTLRSLALSSSLGRTALALFGAGACTQLVCRAPVSPPRPVTAPTPNLAYLALHFVLVVLLHCKPADQAFDPVGALRGRWQETPLQLELNSNCVLVFGSCKTGRQAVAGGRSIGKQGRGWQLCVVAGLLSGHDAKRSNAARAKTHGEGQNGHWASWNPGGREGGAVPLLSTRQVSVEKEGKRGLTPTGGLGRHTISYPPCKDSGKSTENVETTPHVVLARLLLACTLRRHYPRAGSMYDDLYARTTRTTRHVATNSRTIISIPEIPSPASNH